MSNTVEVRSVGEYKPTIDWLNKLLYFNNRLDFLLNQLGLEGCEALAIATPIDTGLARTQWDYSIERDSNGATITWHNFDIEGGYNVAILIQYGHGTGTGGYYPGVDFINPAIQPVFDRFADEIFKEVSAL